jgi:hypothetical protein
MFISHYAVALAGKRAVPQVSLGWLVVAAQWLDLVWPLFVLLGIEHLRIAPGITVMTPLDFSHYPYSHSLVGALFWGALLGGVYFVRSRDRNAGLLLGALVVSHWVLDAIAHRPDLPLYPGGSVMVGLGLWNSRAASMAVEGILSAGGLWLYLRATRARIPAGRWRIWSLFLFLVVIQVANAFSPPPPSVMAVAWSALALWLLVPWAAWADRRREVPAGS